MKRELIRGALFETNYPIEEKYYRVLEVLDAISTRANANLYSKISQEIDRIIILMEGWKAGLLSKEIDTLTLSALLAPIEREYVSLLQLNESIQMTPPFSPFRFDITEHSIIIKDLYKELSDLYLVSRKTSTPANA